MLRVRGLVQDRYHHTVAGNDEAALRELLRGQSPYLAGGSSTRVASFKFDLVSLPESVSGCPLVSDVAPPEVRSALED